MNEFSIEQIEKLRIHELRDYARTVGVSSPTTLKKDELLTRISEVFASKNITPETTKKEDELDFFELLTSDKSHIFNKLLDRASKGEKKSSKPTIVNDNTIPRDKIKVKKVSPSTPYDIPTSPMFSWGIAQGEANYSSDIDVVGGYLDIHPDGYGIVRVDSYIPNAEDVYIAETLIKKKKLKKGSYVSGKVKAIVIGKPKIMYDIEYYDMDVFKAKYDYEDLVYLPVGEELYLEKNKFSVRKGERLYCRGLDIIDCVNIATELAEENSCCTKVLNFRARPEENYESNDKVEIVNCPFNKTEIESLNSIELIVERVKREVELGKPQVLFLYGFSDIVRAFNVAIEGFYDFSKVNAKAINRIKNILYTAKNTTNNLYVSIVCVDKFGVPADLENIMNLEFLSLFNSVR